MYIVETVETDGTRRIGISKIFETAIPSEVVVIFDTDTKRLLFAEDVENYPPSLRRKVDAKKRVQLPRWMPEEIGSQFVINANCIEEHYLLPRKFFELY